MLNLTFDLWFDLDIDQVSKNNSRNGLPFLNNPKKEVLHDHLGYQDEQLKMFHIEDGGGRHLEFREMLNVAQVATKLIWLF